VRHIGVLEHARLHRQLVEIWRDFRRTAVTGKGIGALLVRQKYDQVWSAAELNWLTGCVTTE